MSNESNNSRYTLEPYKGMATRYDCPECGKRKVFVRYIDNETGQYLSDRVGRCNREDKCAYHFTPSQYFKDAGYLDRREDDYNKKTGQQVDIYINPDYVNRSFGKYEYNNFVQFLINQFGLDVADNLVAKYRIGTSKHWPGSTVFWQLDGAGSVRTGKIMLYDRITGKRVKEPYNHITWVHTLLLRGQNHRSNYKLNQCLFGEHLINKFPDKSIALVESEKTAIIASVYIPRFIWLATGGMSNLSVNTIKTLRGRKVVLFPDLNAYDKWKIRASELDYITNITISDLLERKATAEDRSNGYDLADYLLPMPLNELEIT